MIRHLLSQSQYGLLVSAMTLLDQDLRFESQCGRAHWDSIKSWIRNLPYGQGNAILPSY
jgi:hypothetical protein